MGEAEACTTVVCAAGQLLNGAFLSALFGAGGGAFATYLLTSRLERRKRLLDEIAGVNSAISLAATIAGAGFALKGQHINGILDSYRREFDRFRRFTLLAHYLNGRRKLVYVFTADFKEVAPPPTLHDDLRSTIVGRIPSATQAIIVVNSLIQSVFLSTSSLKSARRPSLL